MGWVPYINMACDEKNKYAHAQIKMKIPIKTFINSTLSFHIIFPMEVRLPILLCASKQLHLFGWIDFFAITPTLYTRSSIIF